MRVTLFTYDRPTMLKQTLNHLESYGITPVVYEDGVTHPFRGKQGFWKTWDEALKACEKCDDTFFMFMPEDFLDIDIDRIKEIHEQFKSRPYVYNIINDGRHECWSRFPRKQPVNGHEEVGFCDGGFFCNREALSATKWQMKQPNPIRFKDPSISSGIGQYLTFAFTNRRVKMYKPVESLAYHGNHESKMHKEERKKNPLISK